MPRRIVEITREGAYLSAYRGFLTISRNRSEIDRVPLSDIGVLLITAQGASFSKAIINRLTETGCMMLLCDKSYTPSSYTLPLQGNCDSAARIRLQAGISQPLRKRLWQKIVQAKIRNQAQLLHFTDHPETAEGLNQMARDVQSGDVTNREAVASRAYWQTLFGSDFRRDQNLHDTNRFLNYGYAITRSLVARSLVGTGLHPSFGLHHKSRMNFFALVDDLHEPLRPLVDAIVYNIEPEERNGGDVDKHHKAILTRLIWTDFQSQNGLTPLINLCETYCYSLYQSYELKKSVLEIPIWKGQSAVREVIETCFSVDIS